MQLLQTGRQSVVINGHTVEALVIIRWDYEHDVDFSHWDEETKNDTIKDLEAMKTNCVYLQVEVHFHGLEGSDSLGQVFARSSEFKKDLLETVSAHDMVKEAIKDLEAKVNELAPILQGLTQ